MYSYSNNNYSHCNSFFLTFLFFVAGDVGGQIGLFIGAGVLSYFEFLDCIALVVYTKYFQTFKNKNEDV